MKLKNINLLTAGIWFLSALLFVIAAILKKSPSFIVAAVAFALVGCFYIYLHKRISNLKK